jgi:hypothetical protein
VRANRDGIQIDTGGTRLDRLMLPAGFKGTLVLRHRRLATTPRRDFGLIDERLSAKSAPRAFHQEDGGQ